MDMWNNGTRILKQCKGDCVPLQDVCDGACNGDQCLSDGKCVHLVEKGKVVRGLCDGKCSLVDDSCNEKCYQDEMF